MKGKTYRFILLIAIVIYVGLLVLFLTEALFTDSLEYGLPFVGYGGTFAFHYLEIGEYEISLYWLGYVVGIIFMIMLLMFQRKQYGYSRGFAIYTGISLAVLGFIGAKVLYILENLESVIKNGISLNGVSFFGTVFFLPFLILIEALVLRKKYDEYLDYCTPACLLMLVCIRTGCFLNGCCGGITFWWKSRPVIFPSQLLECIADLILLYLLFQWKTGINKGYLYVVFIGGYGILRFLIEFTRLTDKNIIGMSNGQWFAILCIAIMLILRKRIVR